MTDSKNLNPTKVITGKCRMSYEHVWEPYAMAEGQQEKYSACILIRKDDEATIAKIRAAVEAAIKEGVKSKWKGKRPANLKLPLRDGDEERPEDEAAAGCYFLNANANRQPGVVDLARNPILDRDEVYSGCYCRFSISFYPFSASGNNGVAVGLNHVQKVSDGERLAGGASAESDFDDGFADDLADIL